MSWPSLDDAGSSQDEALATPTSEPVGARPGGGAATQQLEAVVVEKDPSKPKVGGSTPHEQQQQSQNV